MSSPQKPIGAPNSAANHHPRKRFGQHFLHDNNVIQRIVDAIAPQVTDKIVEIGPGQGALTLPLLRKAKRLIAIELDRDLIEPLQVRSGGFGDIEIICADVLNVDFTDLAATQKLRLAGNLPYNISTPILFHCLEHSHAIRDMHFMLQKEVVDRMAAEPGGKIYGRLSVMLQLRCRVEPLFPVYPESFHPPPKVDSAVVRLIPLGEAEMPDTNFKIVEDIVRNAFSQRRKTLSNALRGMVTAAQLDKIGIDSRARAEQIAPLKYAALAKLLADGG